VLIYRFDQGICGSIWA